MSREVNADAAVVADFGAEWSRFDQRALDAHELALIFDDYFRIFPWDQLPPDAVGFDMGAGSGRWAALVAPRVGHLHLVEPSEAWRVAAERMEAFENAEVHRVGVDALPFPDRSMDFGYSLGVLHHIPDTEAALRSCVEKLKPGAPFLVYLYYAFDQRPAWFRAVWRGSDRVRRTVSRLPARPKQLIADLIAGAVYLPLARTSRALERLGLPVDDVPLAAYRDRSFYTMRTDALDRFGTRLEKRYTRGEIRALMEGAGLTDVTFSDAAPYWCALGYAV